MTNSYILMTDFKQYYRYYLPGFVSLFNIILFMIYDLHLISLNDIKNNFIMSLVIFILSSGVLSYLILNIYYPLAWLKYLNIFSINFYTKQYLIKCLNIYIALIDINDNRIQLDSLNKRDYYIVNELIWQYMSNNYVSEKYLTYIKRLETITISIITSFIGIFLGFILWGLIIIFKSLQLNVFSLSIWLVILFFFYINFILARSRLIRTNSSILQSILKKYNNGKKLSIHYIK